MVSPDTTVLLSLKYSYQLKNEFGRVFFLSEFTPLGITYYYAAYLPPTTDLLSTMTHLLTQLLTDSLLLDPSN
jgi:hypothetical protein